MLNNATRTLRSVSGDGSVSLGSAVLTISPSNESLVLNGVVSGSGGLTFSPVNSAGSLTLGGNNSYTGVTTIANGTLLLGASNRISASSEIVIQSGASFHLNGFSDSVGPISGSGPLFSSTPFSRLAIMKIIPSCAAILFTAVPFVSAAPTIVVSSSSPTFIGAYAFSDEDRTITEVSLTPFDHAVSDAGFDDMGYDFTSTASAGLQISLDGLELT